MVGVLQSENVFVVHTENFLFFEWILEKSDVKSGNTVRSCGFKVEGEKDSFLELVSGKYLYLYNPNGVRNGRYVLTISDKKGKNIYSHISPPNSISTNDRFDLLPHSIPVSEHYPIMISCTVKASNTALAEESDAIRESRMRELCLYLKAILDQAINTDMVLNVDGEIIKVHKVVLQARSPVFRKMFDHDSSEAAQNTVVISDVGSAAVKRLVRFLYTPVLEKCNFDETLELYYAADKYEVLSLREDCRKELLINLNVNNACSLFTLANRHNDEDFKKKVVKFVSANFESVVNEQSLNEMDKHDIISLISLCAPNIR